MTCDIKIIPTNVLAIGMKHQYDHRRLYTRLFQKDCRVYLSFHRIDRVYITARHEWRGFFPRIEIGNESSCLFQGISARSLERVLVLDQQCLERSVIPASTRDVLPRYCLVSIAFGRDLETTIVPRDDWKRVAFDRAIIIDRAPFLGR